VETTRQNSFVEKKKPVCQKKRRNRREGTKFILGLKYISPNLSWVSNMYNINISPLKFNIYRRVSFNVSSLTRNIITGPESVIIRILYMVFQSLSVAELAECEIPIIIRLDRIINYY
jgi:hypothetical protein